MFSSVVIKYFVLSHPSLLTFNPIYNIRTNGTYYFVGNLTSKGEFSTKGVHNSNLIHVFLPMGIRLLDSFFSLRPFWIQKKCSYKTFFIMVGATIPQLYYENEDLTMLFTPMNNKSTYPQSESNLLTSVQQALAFEMCLLKVNASLKIPRKTFKCVSNRYALSS